MKQGLTLKSGAGSNVNAVTVNETVAATVSGISTDGPGITIQLEATVDITTGAGTTSVQVRIRRGVDTTGAIVGAAEQPAAGAATRVVIPIQETDQPGEVAGQSYVVTVQQVAATGNATVNQASIFAAF